ncbi:Acylphosphatase [Candidatus Desulfarcum epimagneticum]|uniref:Acylphosphatase n=1 Tax=uncultured Desulfobacteraceae bacterium TaxID=218296 RepID=A0A484HES3_9BACT|nr:Acylphosphatase [uncultured Desulfobacteraceae bacterium]
MKEKSRANVIVSGRVQGVFFRAETKRAADGLGLFGWVKNRPDGTVEAEFEGNRDQADALIRWIRKGPPLSRVDGTNVTWKDFKKEFETFEIRR